MIIKSMSRKAPTFRQLMDYISRGSNAQTGTAFVRSFYANGHDRDTYVGRFQDKTPEWFRHSSFDFSILQAVVKILFDRGERSSAPLFWSVACFSLVCPTQGDRTMQISFFKFTAIFILAVFATQVHADEMQSAFDGVVERIDACFAEVDAMPYKTDAQKTAYLEKGLSCYDGAKQSAYHEIYLQAEAVRAHLMVVVTAINFLKVEGLEDSPELENLQQALIQASRGTEALYMAGYLN